MTGKQTHPNLFDYLNSINNKTRKYPYDKKVVNAFMLSMWLSHGSDIIDVVQEMNRILFSMDDNLVFDYYWYKIPKKKRFIKWVKKIPEDKKIKKELDSIMEGTNLSRREAKMFMEHTRRIK